MFHSNLTSNTKTHWRAKRDAEWKLIFANIPTAKENGNL